jgi:hypothetical protein
LRFLRAFRAIPVCLVMAAHLPAEPSYYWRSLPVGEPVTAHLLTLFCQSCGAGKETGHDIPLISLLRDTLGEDGASNHKLTAVWLLSYSRPTVAQRSLAAVPFFYWRPSNGSPHVRETDTSPLLDLSAPHHPAVANVQRQVLQWSAFDTVGVPARATSRAYRTNEVDHERLHLEEANNYLLRAPVGDRPDELAADERDFLMARLELRKKLLGGFVSDSRVTTLGKEAGFGQERVRTRNWELLRQCAEKTGLVYDPVSLAGSNEQYAMLWYRAGAVLEQSGSDRGPIWKLLNIKDPYSDSRIPTWNGLTQDRGDAKLIPLGLYSLTYPRQPLLMVDFRDNVKLRRRDMTQKAVDELTAGMVGVSHFANWYYFVASDIFNFVEERRGKANNRSERLDSYSEFRVSLALDNDLDPRLRHELEQRAGSLSSNPLESTPANEMESALNRYSWLTVEAAGDNSRLLRRIDNQRREELAGFNASRGRAGFDSAVHALTFGGYTHRTKPDDQNLQLLSVYRRMEHNLTFLDKLVAAGTPPEVVYQQSQISASILELSFLMPDIPSPQIRTHVRTTLASLSKISLDQSLRADCTRATHSLDHESRVSVPGIVAQPAVLPVLKEFD